MPLAQARQFDNARRHLRRALELDSQNAAARTNLNASRDRDTDRPMGIANEKCEMRTDMRVTQMALVAGLTMASIGALSAQKPTPTPLMDSRGLPLPFGVQPYYKPDVPLGSGPYKAIMAEERGLSAHVAYYPADLRPLGNKKLPVVIWGNGSCLYAGNRYRQFLTEIASYGYLVISGGPMAGVEQEVGPQSNP